MSENNANIEIILQHLIEQQDKNNSQLNARLDKLTDMLDKLQSHHIIVPRLALDIEQLQKIVNAQRDIVNKLVYDSEKRDEIKKSITNPLIMRALWSCVGVVVCCMCLALGFSYKSIDIKSNIERQKLMTVDR